MLTIKDINPDKYLAVYIAVVFAKEVLHIFEEKYPEDLRPRKAIEVAEAYLRGEEVYAASAYDAARDARAAYAARSAAYSAAYAASAAASAATAYAVSAAFASAAAISAAFASAAASREEYIHKRLLKMLPYILQYKIENQQSFNNPEKVLEYLNEEQQTIALFHLDSLV